MMKHAIKTVAALAAAGLCGGAAQAQTQSQANVFKLGVIRYDTHSSTNGIRGVGVPAGADAVTGDANTLLLTYERMLRPDLGLELVVGIPPRIKARGAGTVAFLGEVLEARNVAPTLVLNYHFGAEGERFRPYLGVGVNYTRFVDIKTTLPGTKVNLGDSIGAMAQVGLDYAIDRQWGLWGSIAHLKVKSKLVGEGATVLTTTIDFRPWTYALGVSYRF